MATKSSNVKTSGSKSGERAFSTSSGDRVANNHQHTKGKNLGVTSEEMMRLGRNLARVKNQEG